ncbi:MAG TPA: histidinol-phosphate transaminase [Vicinamibacteria bacterium]|nr:histidinol-phosphate transaminase [Vicinamibacteria bacterium]
MQHTDLSRRAFASTLAAAGGALVAGLAPRLAEASLQRTDPRRSIQLNSNENPYGPSPKALAAMKRAQAVAGRYPDDLEEEMLAALAEHHGVDPSRIVMGCGSSEILRLADAAFLAPGRTAVAAEPTFEAVLEYAGVHGGAPVKVPLDSRFRHDLGRMAAACDARTGLVYVCNPNNPTGTVVGEAELLAFLEQVPRSAVVLVDEAYHHFVEDAGYRSMAGALDRFPNLVVARTFSKIHGMAGMRLGYALASEENAKALRRHGYWGNLNAAVLAAARESLRDAGHVARQRALLNGTRRRLCEELARDGRRYIPSEANFVMIDVGQDVGPVVEAFREHGILVGRRFPALATWLRVTMGTPRETDAFLRALRKIVPVRAAA